MVAENRFPAAASGKIDVPFAPGLNPPVFSFSLWARVTGGSGTYRSPLTSRSAAPLSGYALYAAPDDTWLLLFGGLDVGDQPAWQSLHGPAVEAGTWTHLAVTHDGSRAALYVNGSEVASATRSYLPNLTRPLRIGTGATEGDGQFPFLGDVDEVAVFDYALTAPQVAQQFAANAALPRLQIERAGATVRLLWTADGALEAAELPQGRWQEIPGAASPWTVTSAATQRFFRLRLAP